MLFLQFNKGECVVTMEESVLFLVSIIFGLNLLFMLGLILYLSIDSIRKHLALIKVVKNRQKK